MEQVIKVRSKDTEVLYCLNRSSAAQSLYHQLPLRLKIEDYSHDEKIFYPKKLSIGNRQKQMQEKEHWPIMNLGAMLSCFIRTLAWQQVYMNSELYGKVKER